MIITGKKNPQKSVHESYAEVSERCGTVSKKTAQHHQRQ